MSEGVECVGQMCEVKVWKCVEQMCGVALWYK